MAGPTYFADLLKIEMLYSGERDNAANVMWASCAGAHGATLTNLVGVANDLGTKWSTEILPMISNNISLVGCQVSDWTSNTGLSGLQVFSVAGSNGSGAIPAQACQLINFETVLRYRGGRGRVYLPAAAPASLQDNQHWTAAHITNLEANFSSWLTFANAESLGGDLLTMVVYHRGTTQVPQQVDDILNISAPLELATQRRRVRRVGHVK